MPDHPGSVHTARWLRFRFDSHAARPLSIAAMTRVPAMFRSLVALGLFFVASVVSAQEAKRPLGAGAIEKLLAAGVSQGRLADLIDQHGVTFEVTPAIKQQLRAAGAGDQVRRARPPARWLAAQVERLRPQGRRGYGRTVTAVPSAADPGTTNRRTPAPRTATGTRRRTGTPTLGSGVPSSSRARRALSGRDATRPRSGGAVPGATFRVLAW